MSIVNRPCPECGGSDRLYYIAAPNNGGAPYWRCRQCDYTEPDAEAEEGEEAEAHQRRTLTPEQVEAAHFAYTDVATRCAAQLWRPAGRQALDYLRKRGLSDSMIRGAKLGWSGDGMDLMVQLYRENAQQFGVVHDRYEVTSAYDGALLGGLRKPQAPKPVLKYTITIPYWKGETCVLLRGRKLNPKPNEPKYLSPSGPMYASAPPVFYLHHVLDGAAAVILTEGEIKALVAHQEWRAGRSPLPCVATAGAMYLPDELVQALVGKTVYLAYDNEKPKRGERESAGEKAVVRNGNKLRRAGIAVKVIELPRPTDVSKVDLDSYILAHRGEGITA